MPVSPNNIGGRNRLNPPRDDDERLPFFLCGDLAAVAPDGVVEADINDVSFVGSDSLRSRGGRSSCSTIAIFNARKESSADDERELMRSAVSD